MSGKRDSNPRPSAWEADALPTELLPLGGCECSMAARTLAKAASFFHASVPSLHLWSQECRRLHQVDNALRSEMWPALRMSVAPPGPGRIGAISGPLAKKERTTIFAAPKEATGCSSARLECYVRDVEAGGSNPLTPTMIIALATLSQGLFHGHGVTAGRPAFPQWGGRRGLRGSGPCRWRYRCTSPVRPCSHPHWHSR